MELDIVRLRRETAGCEDFIHFDNAGAALMPDAVYTTVIDHLARERHRGGYRAAEDAGADVQRVYASAARLLDCRADEIAIVENATRAWDMAFYAIPFSEGDRILTARSEYCSNYIAMTQVCQRTGARLEVIPDDDSGQVSIEALERALDRSVKLIALTHVPMTSGLVNPAAAVGRDHVVLAAAKNTRHVGLRGVSKQAEHSPLCGRRVGIGQAQHVEDPFGQHDARPGGHPARPHVAKDAGGGLDEEARRLEVVVEAFAPVGWPVAAQRGRPQWADGGCGEQPGEDRRPARQ